MLALTERQGSVGSVGPAVASLEIVVCALKIVYVLHLSQILPVILPFLMYLLPPHKLL